MRHKQKRDQETVTDEDIESEPDVFNYSYVETEDISLDWGSRNEEKEQLVDPPRPA